MNLKEQKTLTILNAPSSFEFEINALASQQEVSIKTKIKSDSPIDWCLIFVSQKNDIEWQINQIKDLLIEDPVLWFAYPKKSSKKYQSDITRDNGWQPLGVLGWEGVRQVAIDEDWSALRFKKVEHIQKFTRSSAMALTTEGKKRSNQKNKS